MVVSVVPLQTVSIGRISVQSIIYYWPNINIISTKSLSKSNTPKLQLQVAASYIIIIMQQQLSEQTFESRQAFIRHNVLAYIDIKKNSPCIVIGLHEHYGLQNYLRLMIQYITNNQQSIVIPSLFNDEGSNDQKSDDFSFLTSLNHQKIAETVFSVCEYAAKSGKKIVLIGFSMGAAIGLKMLEFLDVVDMAFMFYGLPPLEGVRAQLIRAETKIILGSKDKMKYLSDRTMLKQAKQLYENNPRIELVEVENAQHGFMNPACFAYSEKYFQQFAAMIQQKIASLITKRELQPQKRSQYNSGGEASNSGGVGQRAAQNREEQQSQQKKQDGCNLI